MKKWFAYHPEEGFFRFGTAAEAKAEAEAFLEHEHKNACSDDWYEFVDEICWGEIHQQIRETVRQQRMDGDTSNTDIITDYELT